MNARQIAQRALRQSGLLETAEQMRFQLQRAKFFLENARFRSQHHNISFPPLDLLYEIGGRIRLADYLAEGAASSSFLAEGAKRWSTRSPRNIIDWGCGVACVVRHMPGHFPEAERISGTDYNRQMISWASKHVQGVSFSSNDLMPPLPFGNHSQDWLYGLSVLTHLGEEAFHAWLSEFRRILRSDGLLTLTTNGTRCEPLFSRLEKEEYHTRGLVVRRKLDEGRKMFLAYHNPAFFRSSVEKDWHIMEFVPGGMPVTGQDLWWLRPK